MANGTAVVAPTSSLIRKKWVAEGLINAKSLSFTAPYTGNSMGSVVYQVNDISKNDGHEVIFQFEGNLIAQAVVGKETAFGTGETKRIFSDKIRVNRVRTTVDEGDRFDGVDINSVPLNEFADSRAKLADKWVRMKDQAIFDVAQLSPSHRIVTNNFSFNDMLDIENSVKTGLNLVSMSDASKAATPRRPLTPYRLQSGESVWLFIIDSVAKTKFLRDVGSQSILKDADLRGNENRLLKGVIGRIGNLLIVEAPRFFGATLHTKTTGDFVTKAGYATWDKNQIEISGLRNFYVGKTDNKIVPKCWTGESLAVANDDRIFSRGLLLGAGAIQFAMGKAPDFLVQKSQDFGIKSESCLEAWVACKATTLHNESGEEYPTPMAGDSYGIIGVDIDVTSIARPTKP